MNTKLLAGLAVLVCLASGMTFVAIARQSDNAGTDREAINISGDVAGESYAPSPDTTVGSSAVTTTVTVGGQPVRSSVTVR